MARISTSDRYPKACSGICRGVKTPTLFTFPNSSNFQARKRAVVYRWKRYVVMLLCKWIKCVHWWESIDGSIWQFLKPTGCEQLEMAGSGPTWPLNQQTTALSKSNLLIIHVKKSRFGLDLNHLQNEVDWSYFPETDMSWSSQNVIISTYHTISLILFFFLREVVHQRLLGRAERYHKESIPQKACVWMQIYFSLAFQHTHKYY